MNRHSQKGSALLIVLGFLSFMVVSAVSFAIWMRTERLPSSALRRTVANRYLVKAALAQAMSRVDDAVRSHVFPGAWYTNEENTVYHDKNNRAYDWWESRVFMPPDPEGAKKPDSSGIDFPRYAPATKTVSVLNLEALGYLPPAIANDVRLLSRSSWAAKWEYFNFDAGRYAFCAVNVSDFLDINKIAADSPRTSAGAAPPLSAGNKPPASRFSLAYLFRNSTTSSSDNFASASRMDRFDELVHNPPGQWSTAQLVSLMDYNLVIGSERLGHIWSPFVDLASGANNTRFFYEASSQSSPYVRGAERQPFVTGSWFPSGEYLKSDGSANTPLDISQARSAPFMPGLLENESANLMTVFSGASNQEFLKTMYQNGHAFCMLDPFTLFDYLDKNDVPLSLAMPCAERVPMITALAPVPLPANIVEFTPMTQVGTPQITTEWRETSEVNIKVNAVGMGLKSTILFPFNDGGGNGKRVNKPCTAQAFARLVFVAGAAGGAGGASTTVSLRNNEFAKNFRPLSDAEWTATVSKDDQFKLTAGSSSGVLSHTPADNCLLITLPAQDVSWTPPANIQDERDSWHDTLLRFQDVDSGIRNDGVPILRKVDVYNVVPATTPGGQPTRGALIDSYYQVLLNPFDANGTVIDVVSESQGAGDGIPAAAFTALASKYTIQPYLVTWARVTQDTPDGKKTVDMVPATYEDDKAFNNIDNTSFPDLPDINNPLGNTPPAQPTQHAMPIMRFQNTMSFTYADASTATAPTAGNWDYRSCYAVDPRYNWAPENWWFDTSDDNPSGQKWFEAVFGQVGADPEVRRQSQNVILNKLVAEEFQNSDYDRGDRANDPFLFVSNLGYLQSVGELAFLPHLSNMREDGYPISVLGDTRQVVETGGGTGSLYNGDPRVIDKTAPDQAVLATMPCALAAWKSYQNYRTNPQNNAFEFGANLYRRGLVNGSQGFYVNPFTQSQEVMLAALANTPLNYWLAGTNHLWKTETTSGYREPTSFNDYNSKHLMLNDNVSQSEGVHFKGEDVNKVATFLRRRFEDLAAMIEMPNIGGGDDESMGFELYACQNVWADMFDALDWSGALDCTVEEVYDDLVHYYNSGDANNNNYRQMYTQGSGNGYPSLNHYVRGGGKKTARTGIRLNKNRAVHKEDFGLKADPLRAQYTGNTSGTACYRDFFDVDRMFLHSYWRDCFANKQQLFLIFVRAESTALGGAGEGTPAQQGGRAVALVWRDPLPMLPDGNGPTDEVELDYNNSRYQHCRPHRMRVLFYRQFD